MAAVEIHPKGWGYEKWIVNKKEYCGKLLFFREGLKCSFHYHKIKDEVFYVQSGMIYITHGPTDDITKAKTEILRQGDSFHVPVGLRHQMKAIRDTELFEFSTEHFEDDSYRVIKGD